MRYAEVPLAVQTSRVVSVDALRGFNIFWILGADGAIWVLDRMLHDKGPELSSFGNFLKTQMSHAAWEGFRFYDFIFPLFIFVFNCILVCCASCLGFRKSRTQNTAQDALDQVPRFYFSWPFSVTMLAAWVGG